MGVLHKKTIPGGKSLFNTLKLTLSAHNPVYKTNNLIRLITNLLATYSLLLQSTNPNQK